jgi:hypothetical protein
MRYERVSLKGAFALAPPNISGQKPRPQNWRFNNVTSRKPHWSHPLVLEESIIQKRLLWPGFLYLAALITVVFYNWKHLTALF